MWIKIVCDRDKRFVNWDSEIKINHCKSRFSEIVIRDKRYINWDWEIKIKICELKLNAIEIKDM